MFVLDVYFIYHYNNVNEKWQSCQFVTTCMVDHKDHLENLKDVFQCVLASWGINLNKVETSTLTHLYRMESPCVINWTSTFPCWGLLGGSYKFIQIWYNIL